MNRKLLVTLLHKNIEELGMITESLLEENEYPQSIILLATRKTEDIQLLLHELAIMPEATTELPTVEEIVTQDETVAETIENNTAITNEQPDTTTVNDSEPEFIGEIPLILPENEPEPEPEPEAEASETSIETVVAPAQSGHATHENKVQTIADKIAGNSTSTRNENLSGKDNSLSASLANKKIADIKQAISIGDRFRFQRELFRSNGEDMNKTLNYLNLLATEEEAMSFLKSKYGWDETNPTAEDFYQLVKRKF